MDEDTGWYLDHFSPKELARVLAEGPAVLVRSATVGLAAAAVALVAFVAGARVAIGDASTEPGLAAVLTIVGAGISIAFCAFHARRLAAARRWPDHTVPAETVKEHLRTLE